MSRDIPNRAAGFAARLFVAETEIVKTGVIQCSEMPALTPDSNAT